jgi:hypothetical protein
MESVNDVALQTTCRYRIPCCGERISDKRWKREICALVGFCAAYSDNSLSTFWDKIPVSFSRVKNPFTLEEGTEWLSRKVGNKLNYMLRNIPKERRSHLLRSSSMKSSIKKCIISVYRRTMVDTDGRWTKRALLPALTVGAIWGHDNSQGLYHNLFSWIRAL